MSVVVREISQPVSTLYDPMGNEVGTIHGYLEFLDVRVQIRKHQLCGYYINWESHTINIDPHGECDCYPVGFYDQAIDLILQLV
jgi:hypothetical protein